jgi:hypothetical protein
MYMRDEYMRDSAEAYREGMNRAKSRAVFLRYYGGMVEAAGGVDMFRPYFPQSPLVMRRYLDEGDDYLNKIPIHQWDLAEAVLPPRFSKVIREHGDVASSATRLCLLKVAAIMLASQIEPGEKSNECA